MAIMGSIKPKMNRNFLGEDPFSLRMVQEKEGSSRPKRPHSPKSGGTIMPKEKSQIKAIMR